MRSALLLIALLILGGCGPQPPTISNLTYGPLASPVGLPAAIAITFTYADQNMDTAEYGYLTVDPSGVTSVYPRVPLVGSSSATAKAMATLSINFTPTLRGQYTFEIWVIDLSDLESNHLSGVFKVD